MAVSALSELTAIVTAILFSGAEDRIHLECGFDADVWKDVRVGVERQADLRVPQDFLNDLRMDALRQQQRGAGMSEVVNANLREFRRRQQLSKCSSHISLIETRA